MGGGLFYWDRRRLAGQAAQRPRRPEGATVRRNTPRRDTKRSSHGLNVAVAREHCPSLAAKRISPHVLRHTAAMELLHSEVDCTVIALWLGHESVKTTQIYLHSDLDLKEKALAKTTPPGLLSGRYRPDDPLMAYLQAL